MGNVSERRTVLDRVFKVYISQDYREHAEWEIIHLCEMLVVQRVKPDSEIFDIAEGG